MGKPKGKRAHRKIDLGEDAYVAKKQEDAAQGGAVDELPDDSLFFVDNDGGLAAGGGMAVMTRKDKARARVLRVDAILTKAKTAKPFVASIPRVPKGPPTRAFNTKGAEQPKLSKAELAKRDALGGKKRAIAASVAGKPAPPPREKVSGAALYKPNRRFTLDDVLRDDPDAPEKVDPYDLWGSGVKKARAPTTEKNRARRNAGAKAEEAAAYSKHRLGDNPRAEPRRHAPYRPSTGVPAVAVDAVGCSYNPPEDARQDEVAAEVGRLTAAKLKKQLDPIKAPVSNNTANAFLTEELYYAQDELYDDAVDDEDPDGSAEEAGKNPAVSRDGKMTKAQRNKQTRQRQRRAEEEAARLAKRQRRDLSNLKQLEADVAADEKVAAERLARREFARAERRAEAPARLGKHRHQPEPSTVLLKEEVTGSLRKLAGAGSLLRDRLKSLERRELVEPRKAAKKTKSKNYMKYEPGARGEKEIEMHESALKATEATRKMKAQAVP
jgi:nucleolar protein 53